MASNERKVKMLAEDDKTVILVKGWGEGEGGTYDYEDLDNLPRLIGGDVIKGDVVIKYADLEEDIRSKIDAGIQTVNGKAGKEILLTPSDLGLVEMMRLKGTVETKYSLPTDAEIGDAYYVNDDSTMYCWIEEHGTPDWKNIGRPQIIEFPLADRMSKGTAEDESIVPGAIVMNSLTNKASGKLSVAEGNNTEAKGDYSHAEGWGSVANGNAAHAEGDRTYATEFAHAEGLDTKANGQSSHAEGMSTTASGLHSHVEGVGTRTWGAASHAEGFKTVANGEAAHAEGIGTITASGVAAQHVSGQYNVPDTRAAFIVGGGTDENNRKNLMSINATTGDVRVAGDVYVGCSADGTGGQKVGNDLADRLDKGEGPLSLRMGVLSDTLKATGKGAIAIGANCEASGQYSLAIGDGSIAGGIESHAEGHGSVASGNSAHAEGWETEATAQEAHSEGYHTHATGLHSHAEGMATVSSGQGSHAEGWFSIAEGKYQHVIGQYNVPDDHAKFIVGGGFGQDNRKNLLHLDYPSGDLHIKGDVYIKSNNDSTGGIKLGEGGAFELADRLAKGTGSRAVMINDNGVSGVVEATGSCATTIGCGNKATAAYSLAEGYMTTASNNAAHAEGSNSVASGNVAHAEGHYTEAGPGTGAHSEGISTKATADAAHAEGRNTVAESPQSHAEGYYSDARGESAHAEGFYTFAGPGTGAHSEGMRTQADGEASHAEGSYCYTEKANAHAEGLSTMAHSECQHVQGKYNVRDYDNKYADIVGGGNEQARKNISALDWDGNLHLKGNVFVECEDDSTGGHLIGGGASGNKLYQHIITYDADALPSIGGDNAPIRYTISIIDERDTKMSLAEVKAWIYNHGFRDWRVPQAYPIVGVGTRPGSYNDLVVINTIACPSISGPVGGTLVVSGSITNTGLRTPVNFDIYGGTEKYYAILPLAETIIPEVDVDKFESNNLTTTNKTLVGAINEVALTDEQKKLFAVSKAGDDNLAVGDLTNNIASGQYAIAAGSKTRATGKDTIAFGLSSIAAADYSIAGGFGSHANEGAYYSLAFGNHCNTYVPHSCAMGAYSEAKGEYSFALGYSCKTEQNAQVALGFAPTYGSRAADRAFLIGDASNTAQSNILSLTQLTGNLRVKGDIAGGGADYAEYFEWLDGNPEKEDRVGYMVSLVGDKIKIAEAGDDIVGVISGTATVVGDDPEDYANRYLRDSFGRIIYDEEGRSIENPDYNIDLVYVQRSKRPEWAPVGLLGKLYVRDDGTAEVGDYVKCNSAGIATKSRRRTNMKVLSRVDDNIIRILFK